VAEGAKWVEADDDDKEAMMVLMIDFPAEGFWVVGLLMHVYHVDMGASVALALRRGVSAGVMAPGVCDTGVAAVLRLNFRL
jgi:uncharacterized membrane protein